MAIILTESEHVEFMVQLIRIAQKCWQYTFINSLLMTLWFIQVVFALILYKCSPTSQSINTSFSHFLECKHKEISVRGWCISLMESTCKKSWVLAWCRPSSAFHVILKRSISDRSFVTWDYLWPILCLCEYPFFVPASFIWKKKKKERKQKGNKNKITW